MTAETNASQNVAALRAALPEGGLFHEKEWVLSPRPFPLSPARVAELEKLGYQLGKFVRACNELYLRSVAGKAPAWVAELLDRGKPSWLVELSRDKFHRNILPPVVRPDLVLTADGFAIAELDSVPGGIGLTAWLNRAYHNLGFEVIGGPEGMLEAFAGVVGSADLLVSEEASTYRPEMAWLAYELNQRAGREAYRVLPAEEPASWQERIYRFFELFDLPNIPTAREIADGARAGKWQVIPPFKPFLEEKLWFALFWMRPLENFWRRELGTRQWQALRRVIPRTWILDPSPLPVHAVHPGIELQDWQELKQLSRGERELVLKVSGFSELGWGSRSVVVGSDASHLEWSSAVDLALREFPHQPYILQEFRHPELCRHPVALADGSVVEKEGRVRLCPYYFFHDQRLVLGGALATFCPPDKKLLHGMRDAALIPAGPADLSSGSLSAESAERPPK